ncbi:MAG: hypothetical protein IJ786_00600 [Bacteroidaceae bacterium]|nr:hypothetical protein [Bacteroidaceae bacterium]
MKKFSLLALLALLPFLALQAQTEDDAYTSSSSRVSFHTILNVLRASVDADFLPAPNELTENAGLYLVYFIRDFAAESEVGLAAKELYYASHANVNVKYNEETGEYYHIIPRGPHPVVLYINAFTSSGGEIVFCNKEDYDRFLIEAKEYGIYTDRTGADPSFLIPGQRFEGGGVRDIKEFWQIVNSEDGLNALMSTFMITPLGEVAPGQYKYTISIDF